MDVRSLGILHISSPHIGTNYVFPCTSNFAKMCMQQLLVRVMHIVKLSLIKLQVLLCLIFL
jgi:hypothetical protein